MGYYDSVEVSASGLSAERLAMDVIANNIANANTTRTPQGGAFKRQLVIFAQKAAAPSGSDQIGASQDDDPFAPPDPFDPGQSTPANVEGVQVLGITDDQSPDRLVFDPSNPEADARGYVHYPNVEIVKEMVDLMAASRAYQANVAAITASQNMSASDLSILKS
ncbi:MAG TPA: flagellar basal body rod protein FlgC [Candidatus Acidoferrales bacterium]|nr:flagellar basal body rod protein FlgC [Candidatus Acidoferrales bacterium]HTX56536.1 flagellar basal body rod protein FlgC [Candidatus Acidoferrales bacterium]